MLSFSKVCFFIFFHCLKCFFSYWTYLNIFKNLHKITSYVLHLRGAERGNTLKCVSTRRPPAGWGCWSLFVWRRPSSLWKHASGGTRWGLEHRSDVKQASRPLSHLKVWTSGTSLRLWPLILWTSLAAALSIFSTRFSCSCSSWVWGRNIQMRSHPDPTSSALSSSYTQKTHWPVSRPAWGGAGTARLLGPRPAALSGPAASPSPTGSSAPAARAAPGPTGPAASETPAGPVPGPKKSARGCQDPWPAQGAIGGREKM